FPFVFLFWIVPFPTAVVSWIEVFFQYASAEVADWLLRVLRVPVFREGLYFKLPGIVIEVAQECSGIRSSLVLFIVSLIAGHMFLHERWKRVVLATAVIPLGILRNACRIVTISCLCAYVDAGMIDSPIHRHGGPFFFVLSLIPLVALLWCFWRGLGRP